ncbi:MAG TPA: uroporphyrinogen decarboxylase family protein [Bdellovibrionota bacterium]|jgi:uroporphyrinogen decarboxylase|nr:uroporphyrinogen decarboxylase family protein [Bdellovibrionota bacterium]
MKPLHPHLRPAHLDKKPAADASVPSAPGARQRFVDALHRRNTGLPPVWFMRQAGRYHSHYQNLKTQYSFMELCKEPKLAAEVTYGPVDAFGFDTAILFSDLLFPLEVMGMGLDYAPGPQLGWHLRRREDLSKLRGGSSLAAGLEFQAEAIRIIRNHYGDSKGLIGFVGAPLTLYAYAVEGSHQGNLSSAIAGLEDGRFEGFTTRLADLLAENLCLQAEAGPDAIAIFDTCGGELNPVQFARHAVPALKLVLDKFRERHPDMPIVYYSRGTGPDHWKALSGLSIQCLGIDWNHDLADVLSEWGDRYAIQGNIDPGWLRDLGADDLERKVEAVWSKVKALPVEKRRGWVCALGHGVLQHTPEENVRRLVALSRRMFA